MKDIILLSSAFLISTLGLIIFKFLSVLLLGHYPIILINIFFLAFFFLLAYKYRPLSQDFPSSIYFSPSLVGNLVLDIPRKLIYIVTKGPLYRNKEGSNNDIRRQLAHPTTVLLPFLFVV
jgi:hypothetical protein